MSQRLRAVLAKAREIIARRRITAELDEELNLHLEMEIEHNVSRGMSATEARRAALLAFGGEQRFREEANDARGFAIVDSLERDTRFALRRLRRAPTFTGGAIATLAIGLGAFVGIGALVYGVMLRPLPYSDPDRIVRIDVLTPGLNTPATDHAAGTFQFFREHARSFSALGGFYENDGITLTGEGNPERSRSAVVSPNLLGILGAVPAIGRLFVEDDAHSKDVPVLISYAIWQRRFGGDPQIVGKTIEINRGPNVIIGVLPEGFAFPSTKTAVYFPTTIKASKLGLTIRYITAIGRLRTGVDAAAAETELTALVPGLSNAFPETSAEMIRESGFQVVVRPLRDAITNEVCGQLTLLAIVVCAVLLIATSNVATLFLLRAERLRGEIAVSRALGAHRGALTQRFVVEGVIVGLLGAMLAVPVVALALSVKFGFSADRIPRLDEIGLTPSILAVLFGVAAAVGVGLGLGAARRAGEGAFDSTREGVRSTGGRAWRRAQQTLVATQIALALALLLGAALMTQSLARLSRVEIGFSAHDAATFQAALPFRAYPKYQVAADFHFTVLSSLANTPGITAAAAAMNLPLSPPGVVEQRLSTVGGREATASPNVVTPNYFSVLGIPLRGGRTFAVGDLATASPAVVVSAALARDLFGDDDPIGREIRLVGSATYPAYHVVGVVGDVYGLRIADGPARSLYFPLIQEAALGASLPRIPYNPTVVNYVVRSTAPITTLRPTFAAVVARFDARVPIANVGALSSLVDRATASTRLTMILLGIAAAATLILGGVGLYSIIAYAVAGRRAEFAVRLALGATASTIAGLVMHEGVVLATIGGAAGLALFASGARFLRGLLFGVQPFEPVAYGAAMLLLALAVLIAMYLPARRAGRTDPASVLRGD